MMVNKSLVKMTNRIRVGILLLVIFLASSFKAFAYITEVISTESQQDATLPSIAVNDSYIFVVWQENGSDGEGDIYYKRKPAAATDSWANYATEKVSTESIGAAYNPRIAIDNNYIYAVWIDETNYNNLGTKPKIVYKRKDLNGSWSSYSAEVVSTETNGAAYNPQIAVDSTYVYVVWEDTGNYNGSGADRDIFYKNKPLNGSWPVTTELVSSGSNLDSFHPVLSIDANNVYAAWYDYNPVSGSTDILYKKKSIYGSWLVTAEVVSSENNDVSQSTDPAVALQVDANNVHLAWRDNTDYAGSGNNKYKIVYKKKGLENTWPLATEIVSTESDGDVQSPKMVVDADNAYVFWADSSNYHSAGSNYHIFYKKKAVAGDWTIPTCLLSSESSGVASAPDLAVLAGSLYAVWNDNTNLNSGAHYNIFYRKIDNIPPSIQVTYPNGGEYLKGTITVTVTVSDPDSAIAEVKFYYTRDNGITNTLIAAVAAAPYQCNFDTTKAPATGDYKIYALATSVGGGQGADFSDQAFYVDKYYDDTTFTTYSFITDPFSSCYKGTTNVLPLSTDSNLGTLVTDTTALRNKDGSWELISTTNEEYIFMKFNFKVTQTVTDIKLLDLDSQLFNDSTYPGFKPGMKLYIWNNSSAAYDPFLERISANIGNYIKTDGIVQVLLETQDKGVGTVLTRLLYCDYIGLLVSTDFTPPAAITDLKAEAGLGRKEIKLTWTAPGDDGNLRTATGYTIKYATSPFSDTDWDTAFLTTVSTSAAPVPQEAGNTETLTLSLTSGSTYYFSLKTYDEVPNISAISNQVMAIAKTNTAPVAVVMTPAETQNGNINIGYTLLDVDADTCTINIAYSIDAGLTFATATRGQGGDALTNLTASSTTATSHTFVWDSVKDIGETVFEHVQIRIIPTDSYGATGIAATTGNFKVNNTSINDTLSHSYPYPNPFRPKQGALTIKYVLNKDVETKVSIYSLTGELVKEEALAAGSNGARQGTNRITWDGKNKDSEYVASGVYVICIVAEDFKLRQKVAVLK